MKEAFNRTINSMICSAIVAFIVGVILAFCPGISIVTIGIIAGIYVIANGIALLVLDYKASKYFIPFDGILPGILFIILGILLIAQPGLLSVILALTIGVWIVLSSINLIRISLAVRKTDLPWVLLLILAILDLILGVIVIFNPFEASISLTMFVGIMIMAHSIISIVDMIIIKKDVKQVEKSIKDQIKDIKD